MPVCTLGSRLYCTYIALDDGISKRMRVIDTKQQQSPAGSRSSSKRLSTNSTHTYVAHALTHSYTVHT